MAQWRILSGVHYDAKCTPISLVDIPGVERDWENKSVPFPFYTGDVVETEVDLDSHNVVGSKRFEKLADTEPQDNLNSLTVAQLREKATEEEIDLPDHLKKPQLVAALRGALAYQEAITG